jgi:hypothetical protein
VRAKRRTRAKVFDDGPNSLRNAFEKPSLTSHVRDPNVGAAQTPEGERQPGRNRILRTQPRLGGSHEQIEPLVLRPRLRQAVPELRGGLAESFRRIDERVAKLSERQPEEKSSAKQAELDLRARLTPVRLRDGVGRARAAEESLPFAEGSPRARGLLDPQLAAQIEDQHRKTVGQFPAAAKRGAVLFVGVERVDICRERAPRRDACDARASDVGSVFGNAKVIHG